MLLIKLLGSQFLESTLGDLFNEKPCIRFSNLDC